MQIHKKDYSDKLIESYLTESYQPVIGTDQEQKDAEAAYLAELKNGPKQWVSYPSGRYQVNVGTVDLENLHKAYDKYYADNNLLDLFSTNGKLTARNSYGTIKNIPDRSNPAVKALYKLWTAQFQGTEIELKGAKEERARQQAEWEAKEAARRAEEEQKRAEERAKWEKKQAETDKLGQLAIDLITSCPEWTTLTDLYSDADKKNIKLVPELTRGYHLKNYPVNKEDQGKWIIEFIVKEENLYLPNDANTGLRARDFYFNFSEIFKKEGIDDSLEFLLQFFESDAGKQKLLPSIKEKINELIALSQAYLILVSNYKEYIKTSVSEDLGTDFDVLVMTTLNHSKYYELKIISSTLGPGLSIVEIATGARVPYNALWVPAVLIGKTTNNNTAGWRSYTDLSWTIFFNSWLDQSIIDRYKIPVNGREYSGNGGPSYGEVEDCNDSKYFDKLINLRYTCDCSD